MSAKKCQETDFCILPDLHHGPCIVNPAEAEDDRTDRLAAEGAALGKYRQCSIGWHGECSSPDECRCECHAEPAPRSSVLAEADALVNGDRAKDYGDASESFGRLARLWSAQLGAEVSAAQVAQCLALLKLSRLAQTPGHRDSWVDLAGYAALGAEVAE